MEAVKGLLQTDGVNHRLFRPLEQIPFQDKTLNAFTLLLCLPRKTIGELQSVSCPWAMVMANSLGTVRDPTAVLMPNTTIEVALLHGHL